MVESGRSLINIRNNKGPKMEPWGTPNMTLASDECIFPSLTNWDLEYRYDWNRARALPLIP